MAEIWTMGEMIVEIMREKERKRKRNSENVVACIRLVKLWSGGGEKGEVTTK